MGSSLYLLDSGKAVEMSEQPYEQEKELQDFIAQNPNILRSSDPDSPRLFLVKQEFSIAEGGEGTNSYSADHLMVDETGVVVLVEVKRAVDTRTRREVVAQMLDYASRASTWDVEALKASFNKNNNGMSDAEFDNDFWDRVKNNLKAEKLRLIFAADQIPDTLRTLIEFLNRNLADIEVYGVEVRQYQTQGSTLLTSSVIGGGSVDSRKESLSSVEWDAAAFSEYLLNNNRKDAAEVSKRLVEFSANAGLSYSPGHGAKFPSFTVRLGKTKLFTASVWIKTERQICTLDFCIRDLLEKLPSWSADNLRNAIDTMPGKESARKENKIWDSKHFLYVEMGVLAIQENLEAMENNIRELCSALSKSEDIGSLT